MTDGVIAKFYLPKLSDDDLAEAVRCVRAAYDRAPKFGGWLLDLLLDEQARRLASRDGVPRETDPIALPAAEWTAVELVQGMFVVNAMSYVVRNEAVGELIDRLVCVFTEAVGERLIFAEGYIHVIESIAEQEGGA